MASTLLVKATLEQVRQLLGISGGNLGARLNEDSECCMLHTAVMPVVLGVGCEKESLGTHVAIRALRVADSHICMAETGQRVLDRRCVEMALGRSIPRGLALANRSSAFLRKFAGGFAVLPSVYGRGYCYLWFFIPTARSRAARILGQYPFLIDVVKLWAVIGVWNQSYHVSISDVGYGTYHVTSASIDKTVPEAIAYLLCVYAYNKFARVGGTPEFHSVKAEGMLSGASVVRVLGGDVDTRVEMLRRWFTMHGLVLDDQCLREVWLVTRSAAHFGPGETVSKKYLTMTEHLGDRVLSMIMSVRCLAAMLTPADCTAYSVQFKNDALAELLERSGLRACCEVDGLAVTSKANANIFESVIGVLATRYSYNQICKLLNDIGIKFPLAIANVVRDVQSQPVGLTSLQYQRALALVAQGLI